jgi:hypothetical protein
MLTYLLELMKETGELDVCLTLTDGNQYEDVSLTAVDAYGVAVATQAGRVFAPWASVRDVYVDLSE